MFGFLRRKKKSNNDDHSEYTIWLDRLQCLEPYQNIFKNWYRPEYACLQLNVPKQNIREYRQFLIQLNRLLRTKNSVHPLLALNHYHQIHLVPFITIDYYYIDETTEGISLIQSIIQYFHICLELEQSGEPMDQTNLRLLSRQFEDLKELILLMEITSR